MTELPDMCVVVKGDVIEREHLVVKGQVTEPATEYVVFLTQELVKGGLTLRDISEALDVHYDTLCKWRSGDRVPRRWVWCALLRLAVNRSVLRREYPNAPMTHKSVREMAAFILEQHHVNKVPLDKIASQMEVPLNVAYEILKRVSKGQKTI